ncbi:hypothetical protein Golax_002240 [Gossypium laxum]|uniref:Uncharacterized protein n=1 Tax=Gossypium laxum TaxID=34288 RepID=A0A7J9ASG3_9ROSI|nr:hypothetical protein [Gossypium laxum]
MLAWDKVCMLKGMGELEFRDIRLFNIALLSRQVWRLLTINDTLCYDVFSPKYFPEGDIFQSKKVDKPSFTWNSIATVARDCPNAWAILTIGGLDERIINNDFSSCIDWLEEAMRSKEEAIWVIWERVKSLSTEFRIHNVINRPILSPHFVDKKWEKPPTDKAEWAELYALEESIKVARSLNIAKAIYLRNRLRKPGQ